MQSALCYRPCIRLSVCLFCCPSVNGWPWIAISRKILATLIEIMHALLTNRLGVHGCVAVPIYIASLCLSLQHEFVKNGSSIRAFSHLSLYAFCLLLPLRNTVNSDDGSNWEWSCDVGLLVCVKCAIWLILSSTLITFWQTHCSL